MANVLIVTDNDMLKSDLMSQIRYHIPEFKVCNSEDEKPDLVVVDEDLRQAESWKDSKIPVVFMGSKESCFDYSGGQIIIKPFELGEFLDALRAANSLFENSKDGCLEFGGYVLYPSRKEIVYGKSKTVCKLTEKEVAIIKYLYKNAKKYVTKQDLLKEVWGYADDATTHTVETHIYRLRQKVEKGDDRFIETSDGGYRLYM